MIALLRKLFTPEPLDRAFIPGSDPTLDDAEDAMRRAVEYEKRYGHERYHVGERMGTRQRGFKARTAAVAAEHAAQHPDREVAAGSVARADRGGGMRTEMENQPHFLG